MNKNIEMMKKLIAEKKNNSPSSKNTNKAQKTIGNSAKGVKINNGGGLFSK